MTSFVMQNFVTGGDDPLSLDRIRSVLVRLEETIIFSLIERSQFAHNPKIYEKGAFPDLTDIGFHGSWLQWFLKETETFHAKARRYASPDEHPFTSISDLPKSLLPALEYPKILHPNKVNLNSTIFSFYVHSIVPRITHRATLALAVWKRARGIAGDGVFDDDGNYGSAAIIDVEILQGISKRVHYGMFVSESKFQAHPAVFIPLIKNRDTPGLEALITKPEVERALLARLRKKATLYARELGMDGEPIVVVSASGLPPLSPPPSGGNGDGEEERTIVKPKRPSVNGKKTTNQIKIGSGSGSENETGDVVDPPVLGFSSVKRHKFRIEVADVERLYEDWIIPLTKEVEVQYLLQRLDGLSEKDIEELMGR